EGAQVIEITLDTHDPVAEHQFPTEAGSPADSRAGCFEGHGTAVALEAVVNIRKCHAALQIPHPVADGDADPCRHCWGPFHFGRPLISWKAAVRTDERLLDARPGAAGFDTNEPTVAHLPVVADVAASEPTIHGVSIIKEDDSALGEINVAKAPASVEADIKSAPGIGRHRNDRRFPRDGPIGSESGASDHGACDGADDGACAEILIH